MSSSKQSVQYPPESVGRVMKTHIPKITETKNLDELNKLLHSTLFATINYIYVVNSRDELKGIVSLKDLFRHEPSTKISEVMKTELVTVRPYTEQERAAYIALHENLKSLPVVDKDDRILGILDSDTLLKIIEHETNKDSLSLSGILREHADVDTLTMPLLRAIKHRLPWLLVGLLGGLGTATVISGFEETLSQNIILTAFIPMVVYMAGAVGNQLLVLLVRDYSKTPDLSAIRYFIKQTPVIISIAAISASLLFITGHIFNLESRIVSAVSIALFIGICSSIFPGVVIPAVFKQFGVDPADASGPIATTLQDLMSVSIYLVTVTLILSA